MTNDKIIEELIKAGEQTTTGELITGSSEFYTKAANARQAIAALYEEVKRLRAENEWQPIETAPRDGTEIQVCNSEGVHQAWFEDNEWRVFRHHSSTGVLLYWLNPRPTHWQPLPPTPTEEN